MKIKTIHTPRILHKRLLKNRNIFFLSLLFTVLLGSGCSMRNPFVPADEYCTTDAQSRYPVFQQPRKGAGMYRATMKPYCVSGVRYCPTAVSVGEKFRGTASWYGPNFHGELTSNGESYNMYGYTAAHKTLPINTVVRVTNLKNGKSTTVRINDRGPFVKDRIIDLSYQAAKDIGIIKNGTAPVELKVISFDPAANQYAHKKKPAETPRKTAFITTSTNYVTPRPTKKQVVVVQRGGFSVQIASFSDEAKARAFKQKCYNGTSAHPLHIKTKKIAAKPIYSVVIGNFGSIEEAKDYIAKYGYKDAFVVKD
jgi:rare lipoprotein A